LAGVLLGLAFPIGTYLLRLFIYFHGTQTPLDFFLYEVRVHSGFYIGLTLTASAILGAIGFYIGAAKDWLSQQKQDLEDTHDFYKTKSEEEALRAKKLEAVSLLAGGIAHDFNNTLTSILGNIGLAKMVTKQTDDIHSRLAEAEKAISSAKGLTQQLLTFAKGGAPITTIISASEFIEDTVHFISRGSDIRCEAYIPPLLPPMDIDAGQITQVFNNLLINAEQAMPDGGTVEITATAGDLGREAQSAASPGKIHCGQDY
jgi:signal transduction histidine kinase